MSIIRRICLFREIIITWPDMGLVRHAACGMSTALSFIPSNRGIHVSKYLDRVGGAFIYLHVEKTYEETICDSMTL